MYPPELLYSREHQWLRIGEAKAVLGITSYAQQSLGEVVFLELPEIGRKLKAGEPYGLVESVKAVSDLYSPINGIVSSVNEALFDTPELVNADPYGAGWLVEVELEEPARDLVSAREYRSLIVEETGA